MMIVVANPPNIDAIDAVFHVKGKPGVIFTYGQTLYNPSGTHISEPLKAHELAHMGQQENPDSWWTRYLVDMEFRLDQELEAHKAEYRRYCELHADRNMRNSFLTGIAARLSGPLYGWLIKYSAARSAIAGVRK